MLLVDWFNNDCLQVERLKAHLAGIQIDLVTMEDVIRQGVICNGIIADDTLFLGRFSCTALASQELSVKHRRQ